MALPHQREKSKNWGLAKIVRINLRLVRLVVFTSCVIAFLITFLRLFDNKFRRCRQTSGQSLGLAALLCCIVMNLLCFVIQNPTFSLSKLYKIFITYSFTISAEGFSKTNISLIFSPPPINSDTLPCSATTTSACVFLPQDTRGSGGSRVLGRRETPLSGGPANQSQREDPQLPETHWRR